MGLDSVELVMRTEDEFVVTLSDDEAGTVRTVDDLCLLALSRLDLTPSCLSSKAFLSYSAGPRLVSPSSSSGDRPHNDLESLLPESSRREKWEEIASRIDLDFPHLQYPARWRQRFF